MQKEQLSAYMDGEQVKTDLTDALLRDEELHKRLGINFIPFIPIVNQRKCGLFGGFYR